MAIQLVPTLDILKTLQDGDLAGLELEKSRESVELAKQALEVAKERFEAAKASFEDIAQRVDEAGMPKAKFKKVIEERTAVLWNSGFVTTRTDDRVRPAKVAKTPKKSKQSAEIESDLDDSVEDSNIDFNEASETHDAFVN